jgi:hypothetical protein
MKRKVLEAFDYAYDGVHVNRLKAGRSYQIRDEHVARFEDEGKIERLEAVWPPAEPPEAYGESDMMQISGDGSGDPLPAIGAEDDEPRVAEAPSQSRGKSRGKGRGKK